MKMQTAWMAGFAALALWVAAGPAAALPIVFDGPAGFGISAASAASAQAAGVQVISVDSISTAAALNLTIPEPDVLSFDLTNNPSVSNPNRATSEWSVTNGGPGGLSDAWLVFLNPVTYAASQVGFEIDGAAGWVIITVFVPDGQGGSDYFYPARFLGDLDSSDTVDFLMRHLVGEPLHEQGAELVLPQYSVGALQGIPVPEPAALVLAASAFALAALLRRRSA